MGLQPILFFGGSGNNCANDQTNVGKIEGQETPMEEMVRELTPQEQENLQWEVTLRNEVQGTNGIRVLPSNSEEIDFDEWENLFQDHLVKTDFNP